MTLQASPFVDSIDTTTYEASTSTPTQPSREAVGPVCNVIAEQVARIECVEQLLASTDWSNLDAMYASVRVWPHRTPERTGIDNAKIRQWHGDEVSDLKRAVLRAGRHQPITTALARQVLEWRLLANRKSLGKLLVRQGLASAIDANDAGLSLKVIYQRRLPRWFVQPTVAVKTPVTH